MKLYGKKYDCYGCEACASICPRKAIKMKTDEQGFSYPEIDESICINCHLCENSCQISRTGAFKQNGVIGCFGVKNMDNIRALSSSGGVFTTISEYIMSGNGLVAGVEFDESMNVVHSIAETTSHRERFRGSKYVQSKIGNTYIEIGKYLRIGRQVLFSGTPCQVSGLLSYLRALHIDQSNLVTIDLVCHGAPSPMLWQDYIKEVEKKSRSKVIGYSFRDKDKGWHGYHTRIELDNGAIVADTEESRTFAEIFSIDVAMRPSCFFCPYACMHRVGDVTIGDFWGVEKIDSDFADNKGVSLVLSNTEKGERLISECFNSDLEVKKYKPEQLTQPNLYNSSNFGDEYDQFWTDYLRKGWKHVARKYGYPRKISYLRVKRFLTRLLR